MVKSALVICTTSVFHGSIGCFSMEVKSVDLASATIFKKELKSFF